MLHVLTYVTLRGLVIDPANTAVKVKLHWVPYDVPNCQVKKELERYGKVSEITRDLFRERGFEAVESNTRSVRLTLREAYTIDSLPHELRLEGCKVLAVVPGRGPLCLRCRRTGHIRRDCRVPRCADCHRYGHETADCIRTYATMARDRKAGDQTDYMMDDTEAEEAVSASAPAVPHPFKGATSDDPEAVRLPVPEAQTSAPETTMQGAEGTGEKAKKTPDARAPSDGNDGSGSQGPAVPVPTVDAEMIQVVKRMRDSTPSMEDTEVEGTGTTTEHKPRLKKIRVQVKPRNSPDDRRKGKPQ
ncbi:uncharacterized protein LOC115311428 [Ixodes scapularis]|uniref:uncharacterized protein LOC115311428 n=1 Tax=Ixodes scapularis TaxID=6945 RepID=UPI001C38EBD9|nr:uncharacterized protein LOC115311428 [Ixodes scapularis]